MTDIALLEELERISSEVGLRVSYESLVNSVGLGGLCKVKGEYRLIIDKRAELSERITMLSKALGRFDTHKVEMSEDARRAIGPLTQAA